MQGVFFRASTREQARRLGLRGYARNLHDGRVEVVSAGADEAVDALARWLGSTARRRRASTTVEREARRSGVDAGPDFDIG